MLSAKQTRPADTCHCRGHPIAKMHFADLQSKLRGKVRKHPKFDAGNKHSGRRRGIHGQTGNAVSRGLGSNRWSTRPTRLELLTTRCTKQADASSSDGASLRFWFEYWAPQRVTPLSQARKACNVVRSAEPGRDSKSAYTSNVQRWVGRHLSQSSRVCFNPPPGRRRDFRRRHRRGRETVSASDRRIRCLRFQRLRGF